MRRPQQAGRPPYRRPTERLRSAPRPGRWRGLALALALAACAPVAVAPPSASAPATPTPSASPAVATAPPATPSAPPPSGPDARHCTVPVALPPIPDVIGIAWSPDGHTLAIDRVVALPSDRITGSPEEFFLDALDLATGTLRPLGVGERQQWSGSGRYLSYWSWNGELRITVGGLVIAALPDATIPDARWVGDTLYYFAKDTLQAWSDGATRTIAALPAGLDLRYPADDAAWSADAERFTITRYALDGGVRRYLGTTRSGTLVPLEVPDATYTEWAPRGATLLVRTPDRLELRDDAGVRTAPLAQLGGPVHQWAPDGRTLLLGPVTPQLTSAVTFDTFAAWGEGPAALLPDLVGPRAFSPDGRFFSGDRRTGLRTTELALYRCGSADAPAVASGAPFPAAEQRALRPVVGAITQVLTPRHTGIDLAAPLGALIVADDDGVVTAVGWVAVGGRRICVGHPSGVESCAYHTSAALVRLGDRVARGQPIALVGLTGVTTGPHVHWEATVGTRIVDPLAR